VLAASGAKRWHSSVSKFHGVLEIVNRDSTEMPEPKDLLSD